MIPEAQPATIYMCPDHCQVWDMFHTTSVIPGNEGQPLHSQGPPLPINPHYICVCVISLL